MSFDATKWAWESGAAGTSLLVLLALADYAARGSHECHPAMTDLAAKTGLTDRSVRTCIRQLEAGEWIYVEVSSGGRRKRSTYRLRVGETRKELPGFRQPNPEAPSGFGDAETRKHVPGSDPETRKHVPKNPEARSDVVPKTSHEPKNTAVRATPAAPDLRSAAARANELVAANINARPKTIKAALVHAAAEFLTDGIPDPAVAEGLRLWDAKGYAPSSLASFVSQAQTAARSRADLSVWDKPPTEIRDEELTPTIVNEILGQETLHEYPPDEIEFGDPNIRQAWYTKAATAHLNRRRIKARTELTRHWGAS